MTEPEARTKPISEVWERLKLMSAAESFATWNFVKRSCGGEVAMLRAVLLERCKAFASMRFEVQHNVLIVTHKAKQVFWNIDAVDEISAIYAFWAWELKQRNSESNG